MPGILAAMWLPVSVTLFAFGILLLGYSPADAGGLVRAEISRADCRQLVEHVPNPDVAYKPGVDVYGRPVPTAEYKGNVNVQLPEAIVIDLDFDLAASIGIPVQPGAQPEIRLGKIVVRGNRAWYNNQPLFDEAQAVLAAKCGKRLYSKG